MVDSAQKDEDIPLRVTSLTSLTQLIESQGGANQVLTQRNILVTLSGSLPGFPLVTKPRSVSFLLCTSWLDSLSQKMTLRPSSKVFVPKILWLAWHWHCWETGETSQSTNSKCDTSTTKHNRSAIWLLIICELGKCPFVIGIGDHCQILTDIWWYHLSFLCKTVTFLFYTVTCLFCGSKTWQLTINQQSWGRLWQPSSKFRVFVPKARRPVYFVKHDNSDTGIVFRPSLPWCSGDSVKVWQGSVWV